MMGYMWQSGSWCIDINNYGPISTDVIGASWNYPESSWDEQQMIIYNHTEYTKGFLWFLLNDERYVYTILGLVNVLSSRISVYCTIYHLLSIIYYLLFIMYYVVLYYIMY